MTLEEWDDLPDEIEGELVDGYLVEEEVPGALHEVIVSWLAEVFGPWARRRGAISVTSGVKYALAVGLGRKPDFSVLLANDLPPGEGLVRKPPYIAVEIVSRTARDRRRDRVEKHEEYARFGIRWYWIIDPRPRTVEIFALGTDLRYASAFSESTGRHDDIPGFPGLSLDLDDLWAQVARLA